MDWTTLTDNPIVLAIVVLVAAIAFPQLAPLIGPVLGRILNRSKPADSATPYSPPVSTDGVHPFLDLLRKLVEQRAVEQSADAKAAWDAFVISQITANSTPKKSTA